MKVKQYVIKDMFDDFFMFVDFVYTMSHVVCLKQLSLQRLVNMWIQMYVDSWSTIAADLFPVLL